MSGAAVTSTPPFQGSTPLGNASPPAKTETRSYRPSPSRSSRSRMRPEVGPAG